MNTSLEVKLIKKLLRECPAGPRIELGVFKGHTLALMTKHPHVTIGVDSFAGMPEPTEKDLLDGKQHYPKGRLAAGMSHAHRAAPTALLIRGFVPDVLKSIDVTGFAFAHVDMDHFMSTLQGLQWLWPRMCTGGILCCDDWFIDRMQLAAGAIVMFGNEINQAPHTSMRKAWWVKGDSNEAQT